MASTEGPSRREVLGMMGALTVTSTAGCQGDDSSNENLGERVPELTLEYWPNAGAFTTMFEQTSPAIEDALNELGVSFSANPVEQSTNISHISGGEHTYNFCIYPYTSSPARLDPEYAISLSSADQAGSFPGLNSMHYANCEYTDLYHQSTQAGDPDERFDMIDQAFEIFSQDVPTITISNHPTFGIYRSDEVEAQGLGLGGFTSINVSPFIYSTPINGDRIVVTHSSSDLFATRNYLTHIGSRGYFNNLFSSTLTRYDENFELTNVLADSVEIESDTRFVVELVESNFHNGDPVTAEDVKFSFVQRWDNHETYPQVDPVPYESVDIVDDRTIQIDLEEVWAPMLTRTFPQTGILHKASWEEAGVLENPSEAEPRPFIGSGPFQIETFERGQVILSSPFEDHPVYSPTHDLQFVFYADLQSSYRALSQNEAHVISGITPEIIDRAEQDLGDAAEPTSGGGTMFYAFHPTNAWGPTKFRALRLAIGMAIDRQRIVEQVYRGNAEIETHCRILLDAHPAGTPTDLCLQYTDDVTGDVEGARSVLEDAGFGWDDDGNLHYPPDADLSPLWPEGEKPIASDTLEFPCLDEDGWVPPEER